MELKVQCIPNYRIAFVRQIGAYGAANIHAMTALKQWAKEAQLLTEAAILFGIPQDNPQLVLPESCRYDACVVVDEAFVMDETIINEGSIHIGEFIGGQYAVCTIKHTAEEVQKAWSELFPALQAKGYTVDNKPIIERYDYNMLNQHLCEICVPIV